MAESSLANKFPQVRFPLTTDYYWSLFTLNTTQQVSIQQILSVLTSVSKKKCFFKIYFVVYFANLRRSCFLDNRRKSQSFYWNILHLYRFELKSKITYSAKIKTGGSLNRKSANEDESANQKFSKFRSNGLIIWRNLLSDLLALNYAHGTCVTFSLGGREYLMFIEDQVFSPPYNLAPPAAPPSHPLPSASYLFFFSVFLCVADWVYWREREARDGGWAKLYDGRKAWSSINHSILSFFRWWGKSWINIAGRRLGDGDPWSFLLRQRCRAGRNKKTGKIVFFEGIFGLLKKMSLATL